MNIPPSCRRAFRRLPLLAAAGRVPMAAAAGLLALATALGGCAHALAVDPSRAALDAALRAQPVVLLGEVHDNARLHALRAAALRDFVAGGARPVLLMEQFDRERQGDLDRALAQPGITPEQVIAAAAPADAGWDWALYRPVIALAIERHLRILAANVSRDDTRRVLRAGLASEGFEPRIPADIADAQGEEIEASHCGVLDAATARRMVPAQAARDQFMARLLDAHAADGAVLLAGNGHVRRDLGVPRWLAPATRAKSVAVGLVEAGSLPDGAFDRTITVPAQARPDPCDAFRDAAPPGMQRRS